MPNKSTSNKFAAANVAATKARKEHRDRLKKMMNGTKRQRVLAHHAMQYLNA